MRTPTPKERLPSLQNSFCNILIRHVQLLIGNEPLKLQWRSP